MCLENRDYNPTDSLLSAYILLIWKITSVLALQARNIKTTAKWVQIWLNMVAMAIFSMVKLKNIKLASSSDKASM